MCPASSPDPTTCDAPDKNVSACLSGDINVENCLSGQDVLTRTPQDFPETPGISPALPSSRALVPALLNATAVSNIHDTKKPCLVVTRLGVVAVYGALHDL
jgi:hypothetical protein